MIRVGVIGHGYSATTFHLPHIIANETLSLVAMSSSKALDLQAQYPTVTLFKNPEELIKSGLVDLVIITAPNSVHYSLAKLSLENNLHVVIEKPMVTVVDEGEKLRGIADSRGLVLSTFHNRRWDGDFLTIQKMLSEKKLGDVKYFESHFDRFRPDVRQRWREEPGPATGIWYDLGAHLVDQVLVLFGKPKSLTARCSRMREKSKTTDYFHVQLHYPDLEIVLHGSSFCAGPNMRYKLEGTKGTYIKYGLDPQEQQLKEGLAVATKLYGNKPEEDGLLYSEEAVKTIPTVTGCYQKYYAQLAEAITAGGCIPVSANESIAVLNILALAERSSELGQTLELN